MPRYQYKREPLTQDEANRLANACQTHEEKLVVWTLLDTGLRVAELANLTKDAQFIVVCSSVKTCKIGENLLSVSNPVSGPQEMLIHAGFLVPTPTLQR
jgi:hypothetical protein